MTQNILRTLVRTVAFSAIAALSLPISATVITLPLSIEYSGGSPPVGAVPWITAVFDDENSPGTVKLKLTATNLTGSEFVGEWNFNLNPAIAPADISFSAPTKSGGNGFDDPTISKTVNAFSAGPDGSYDIEFNFATSNMGGGIHRFGVGEMAEYVITGTGSAAGLVAADFAYKSQAGNAGVGGPFFTGAHVQGIGPGASLSGWITVAPGFDPHGGGIPEPATWLLVALSAGTLGLRRSKAC